jgi:hypothetical protein
MQAEVEKNQNYNNRQTRRDREADLGPPFRHGLERISGCEYRVGDSNPKPGIMPVANHREQPFVHLLHRLIFGLHD